jgi:hypothetical protein
MDKQGVERSRKVQDALGESAGSRSEELTEPVPIVCQKSGRRTNVTPREFITPITSPSLTITYGFLNRKYGELDSRQTDENKQRNVF